MPGSQFTFIINAQYVRVMMVARVVVIIVAILLYYLFQLPSSILFAVIAIVLVNFAYDRLLMPRIFKVNKLLALYFNSTLYIMAAVLLVYYTGALQSPLLLLLLFAPIGMAMSYGIYAAFYTVGLEISLLVLLSVLEPTYSILNQGVGMFIMYLIPLLMTAPFAAVTAKRYIDVDQEKSKAEALSTQLEETLRKERDMLDILGHELRTPLGTVRNAIKMLLRSKANGQLTDEQLNKYLVMSDENSVRLAKILETILSSTKIDNNRLTLSFDKVDMQDAVNDTVEANRRRAEEKGLQLSVEAPAQIFSYGDRDRVQEIVDNLVDNAIKYTDKGSIAIKLKQVDQLIILDVIDTGKGIPEEDIPKLGEKFYRSQTYLENKELDVIRPGGTGLGLYVTFSLAKAMGGEIVVTSKIGEGSTFSLRVPAYTGQEIKKGITMQDLIEEKFNNQGSVSDSAV